MDTDWPDDRRQEVIDYIVERYGQASIAQIITFGTMAAKAVVRSIGRALDMNQIADKLARAIPAVPGIKLKKAMEMSPDFAQLYESNPDAKHIVDIAYQLEGIPVSSGTHAAGVLITDELGLLAHVPLCRTEKGIVAQYNMGILDELGLLKVDILGLQQLKIIVNATKFIEKNYGVHINPYDLYKCDDSNAFKIIADGLTAGIFQLEGDGMTKFMKDLQPIRLDEIIAGVALYRPGPMDMIPQYIAGKRDINTVHYDFDALEPIFKETYGVMVYQEQCMRSAIVVAGYQKHHSDSLRKGIAKKKKDLIAQHREWFICGRAENEEKHWDPIPGGIQMGHDEKQLNMFYDKMEKFGAYSFNKSHAACYAILAYVTAWLKTYYPTEYMAALMNEWSKDFPKISKYIQHCNKDLGIKVLSPDINASTSEFVPTTDHNIIYTLFVKEVAQDKIDEVVKIREESGPFQSFEDYLFRSASVTDRATTKAMIAIGAFDNIHLKRSVGIASIDDVFDKIGKWKNAITRHKANSKKSDMALPELSRWLTPETFPNLNEYPDDVRLKLEKSYLGIYLSSHPLYRYVCSITSFTNFSLADIDYYIDEETKEIVMNSEAKDGQRVQFIGQLDEFKVFATKSKGQLMAVPTFQDLTGSAKVMIFPNLYSDIGKILKADEIYQVKGTVQIRSGDEPIIIANSIVPITDTLHKRVIFNCNRDKALAESFIKHIADLKVQGKDPVYVQHGSMRTALKRPYWVDFKLFEQYCDPELFHQCKIQEW